MHALLLSEELGRDNWHWFTDDKDCEEDTNAREDAWRAGALGPGVSSEIGTGAL